MKDAAPQNKDRSHVVQPRGRLSRHKTLFIRLVVCIFFIAVGGVATFFLLQTLDQNAAKSSLLTSLQNTLQLQEVKFDAKINGKVGLDNTIQQALKVDGIYKKKAGLSANADSDIESNGIKLLQKSRWIIDGSNNVYINLTSYDTQSTADSTIKKTPAMEQMIKRITTNNTNRLKDVWQKYDKESLDNTFAFVGVQGCLLKTFFDTQNKPQDFQNLAKDMAKHVDIKKTASASGTDTYTVTLQQDKNDDASAAYTNSPLYKSLVECDKTSYASTTASVKELLKNLTITVSVDTAKKQISSLSIVQRGKERLVATLTEMKGANITVPANVTPTLSSATITAEQMRNDYPYDYEHLMEMSDNLKYGACYNIEKYKEYITAEVRSICDEAKEIEKKVIESQATTKSYKIDTNVD